LFSVVSYCLSTSPFPLLCLLLLSLTRVETPVLMQKITHGTYETMK